MRTGRHVIIGASAAGVSAALASRRAGFTGEIVVVGAEPHPPYERPPLSKRLVDVDDMESALSPIVPADQLRSNDIVLRLGLRARAIDPSAGTVLLDDGETLAATAGVVVDDGVVVDEHGRTSLPCHGCSPPVTSPAARMCTASGAHRANGTTRSIRARSAGRWPKGWPGMARRGVAGRAALAQDRDLMAQHEELGVLGHLRAGQQREPADELTEAQVEQPQRHDRRSSRTSATDAKLQVNVVDEVLGTPGSTTRFSTARPTDPERRSAPV